MSHPPALDRLTAAYQTAPSGLLCERTPEGHWVGALSTSALSTAPTGSALPLSQNATSTRRRFDPLTRGGLSWLAEHQNTDGGWGDTVKSLSNISTTMLCRAAFHLTGAASSYAESLRRANVWLWDRYGKTAE